jgi:superoxide dismutase, Fe-Mn family
MVVHDYEVGYVPLEEGLTFDPSEIRFAIQRLPRDIELYIALCMCTELVFCFLISLETTPDSRRAFFQKGAAAVIGATAGIIARAPANAYDVPDLPYAFEALEPYIDAPTMKIHHDKHHATYVANLNKATEGKGDKAVLDLMENALDATAIRNNGGGHYNHAFFWDEMAPHDVASKTKPSKQLEDLINKSFGSMDEMKAKFEAQAAPGAVFGSGWVWVCVNQKGDALQIVGTPNQDNPLMKGVSSEIMFPILGLDVWEHAYYLKYQNRRPEYVSNWWNVVNWDKVSENCAYVVEKHAGVTVRG